MKKLTAIALASLMSVNSFAQVCEQPVKLLDKDTPAPCRGYLFTPEKELQVRLTNEKYKNLSLQLDNKEAIIGKLEDSSKEAEKIIDLQKKQINIWEVQAKDSTIQLVEMKENRNKRDWLWFAGGILLTLAVGYGVKQVGK